jgi:hypothetical protein
MTVAEELRAQLQEFLASGSFEIQENNGRVRPSPPISWEVRGWSRNSTSAMELQAAALVYLVAPSLHFHSTTATILSYLTPEMEVIRVGLVEGWRRGVRVSLRHS